MIPRLAYPLLIVVSGWAAAGALLLGHTAAHETLGLVAMAGAAAAGIFSVCALHQGFGAAASVLTIHGLIVVLLVSEQPLLAVIVAGLAALIHVLAVQARREPRLGGHILTRLIPGAAVVTVVAATGVLLPGVSPWLSLVAPIAAILAVALPLRVTLRAPARDTP
ncbi:hypothetical protein ONR57_16565 [Hoyosella sp. YIM 151337]|uniref:hypothetical protein n=1 Tax=Hoyosella sp. YIM 151337 TaxID=2992742 RepID=UPI0022362D3A|nr:hypothetical protein [Hoyosella sp. YIM 151337]MCW4354919.1 hypothetical protein [Hoyosella sp. YIM 151337]